MKNIKIIILTLIIFIACLVCVSCSANGGRANSSEESNKNAAAVTEEASETAASILRPDIPQGTDYNGYEFKVITPATYIDQKPCNEVSVEQENGEPLNDAVYLRNSIAESLLNIKIISVNSNVHTDGLANFVKKIILAGSDEFDAIVGANWTPISLVQARCLKNLYNVPNIDLSKPWWDQRMIEDLSYKKSKLFYISGDINYYDKYGIAVLLFNKKLFTDNGFEYPYEKVRNDVWTFNEFVKLVKDFSRDLNGDGKMDENDQWGIIENVGAIIHFLPSCGEKIAVLDSEGIPVINTLSDRHITVVSALCDLFCDKNNVLLAENLSHIKDPYNDGIYKVFRNGQCLFSSVALLGVVQEFRDMEDDFGYLPFPKFDGDQKEYYHFQSFGWSTSYSIPVTNLDPERTGMILEVMAGYSSDTIIPALIDVSLKSKFARDNDSEEMLEIVFKTKTFDLGVEYQWGGLYGIYNTITREGFSKFVSSIERQMPKAQIEMEQTIAIFEESN